MSLGQAGNQQIKCCHHIRPSGLDVYICLQQMAVNLLKLWQGVVLTLLGDLTGDKVMHFLRK